jgi:hypothetical protein
MPHGSPLSRGRQPFVSGEVSRTALHRSGDRAVPPRALSGGHALPRAPGRAGALPSRRKAEGRCGRSSPFPAHPPGERARPEPAQGAKRRRPAAKLVATRTHLTSCRRRERRHSRKGKKSIEEIFTKCSVSSRGMLPFGAHPRGDRARYEAVAGPHRRHFAVKPVATQTYLTSCRRRERRYSRKGKRGGDIFLI